MEAQAAAEPNPDLPIMQPAERAQHALTLRMRDDAMSTKDRQLVIVTSQNEQLRASLEQVEAELSELLEARAWQRQQRQSLPPPVAAARDRRCDV